MVRAGRWVGLEPQPLPQAAAEDVVEDRLGEGDGRHGGQGPDPRELQAPRTPDPQRLQSLSPAEPRVRHLLGQQAEEATEQDEAHYRLGSGERVALRRGTGRTEPKHAPDDHSSKNTDSHETRRSATRRSAELANPCEVF